MRKLIVVASVAASLLLGCDQKSTDKRETLSETLVAKSLSNMVPVKGGEFLMGDFGPLVGEKLPFSINQDDKVLHKVVLSDFSISKYKITNDDYNKYLQITGVKKAPIHIFLKNYPSLQKGYYSVGVTWQQAKDYCQWLGKESGKKFDLPTEAQWEYAAAGGESYPYAGSDNIRDVAYYASNANERLHPVGEKRENGFDLYDMSGNAAEWCTDWMSRYENTRVTDPQGPAENPGHHKKIVRGGSYLANERDMDIRHRSVQTYDTSEPHIGFRVVLNPIQ